MDLDDKNANLFFAEYAFSKMRASNVNLSKSIVQCMYNLYLVFTSTKFCY